MAHLAATGDPVTLSVPHHDALAGFTPEQLDILGNLQGHGRLRIFTAPGPGVGSTELTILSRLQEAGEPEQPGDIPLAAVNQGRIERTPLAGDETMYSHQPVRGYALDDEGVSHGWLGSAARGNPARTQARAPALTQQPADPRTDQIFRTQSTGLLADTELPDSGVVKNLAGVPVWGWVPAAIPPWDAGQDTGEALIGLLRQAGRSGLQLVVEPDSEPAGQLRAAIATLQDLTPDQWREFWERSGRALENHGSGLGSLSGDEMLHMLVTDRNVRIVDENGVVRPEFNARLMSVSAEGQPKYLTGSVALRLGEEYALRADGRFSRSISWDERGRIVAHVRRAVSPSDPATETPELAAGLGLGTAAVKELPGAEKVHQTSRSLILDMISNLPLAGHARSLALGDQPRTRYATIPPAEQASLDRQLQAAFSLPKLRAARSRGLDNHLHKDIDVAGRTYRIDVRAVKVGGDQPDSRDASAWPAQGEPGRGDRGHQQTRSELGVAVDHQAKGARGGGEMVGRSFEAGAEAGGSYRFRTRDSRVQVDTGDLMASFSYTQDESLAISSTAKHYLRLRSQPAEVFRPQYPVFYQVTVTEISRSWDGSERTRVASRLIDASLPAIVHPAFLPAQAVARGPEYERAYRDVAATMGRTTVLSISQFLGLERRRLDFSQVGSAGLNVFVTGLRDAVRQAARLATEHARNRRQGQQPTDSAGDVRTDPAAPSEHLSEIDTLVTEGFLRASLPRLLAGEGVPVSLPVEYHRFTGPTVSRSLTMSAFLVPASDALGYQAPEASNESYVESDIKITQGHGTTLRGGVSFSFGPTAELGSLSDSTTGSGQPSDSLAPRNDAGLAGQPLAARAASPVGPGSKSGSSLNSRRAVRSRVGVTADGSATMNLFNHSESRTAGTIDLGLLTEPKGQQVTRAHLVLTFESARQPGDAGLLGVPIAGKSLAERLSGPGALSFSRDKVHLLVENAVELFKSDTLHEDLQNVARREPDRSAAQDPGREGPLTEGQVAEGSARGDLGGKGKGRASEPAGSSADNGRSTERRFVLDDATGYAVGFPVHFDASHVRFSAPAGSPPGRGRVAVTGLTQAIAAGMRATGLVGDEFLNDTSDIWRAITARYGAEAVRNHLHDLLGVGIIHRAEIPVNSLVPLRGGRTHRLTIVVTGAIVTPGDTAEGLRHERSRAKHLVTFGGQALMQSGRDSEALFRGGLSVNIDGRYTANRRSYLETALGVGLEGETSTSIGTESVARDIRRSVGSAGAEEFSGELSLKVEIFADTEQIEPIRRAVQYNAWLPSWLPRPAAADTGSAAPLVALTSDLDTRATAQLAIPKSLTTLARPGHQRTGTASSVEVKMMSGARLLDRQLGKRLLALQFPDLQQVARWAPTTMLPRGLAISHALRNEPALVSSLSPPTDQGVRMLQVLSNRYVRNNVNDLFSGRLSLSAADGSAITVGATSGVLRRLGPGGDYSGLSFREEAEEPTVVLGGSSELRLTLAAGGGNATLSSVPEFLAPEWQSGRSFRGFNGDYREFNESFRTPAYPYGGLISYEIRGPHDYFLTVDSGGQFSGLLLEPWAEELAASFPSSVVHPFATELPADQGERDNAIRELADRPGGPEPMRLLADPGPGGEADEFMESARWLAIDLGGDAEVDLAVVRYDGAGRALNLAHYIFRMVNNDEIDEKKASQDYRNQLRLMAMHALSVHNLDTAGSADAIAGIQSDIDEADAELRRIAQRDLHRRSVERARDRGEQATGQAENTSSLAWSAGAQAGEDPLDQAWRVLRSALVLPASNTDLAQAQRVDAFDGTTNVFIGGSGRRDLDTFLIRDRRMTTAELAREIVKQFIGLGLLRPYLVLHESRAEQAGQCR